jgi:hypothetical protein
VSSSPQKGGPGPRRPWDIAIFLLVMISATLFSVSIYQRVLLLGQMNGAPPLQ